MTAPVFEAGKGAKSPEATRKLLASLWERNLPLVRERFDSLDRAVVAAHAGTLTSQQRTEATETAHKLAGSLGMFGYPEGTEFARSIEQHLEGVGPVNALRLAEDVAAMRAAVAL